MNVKDIKVYVADLEVLEASTFSIRDICEREHVTADVVIDMVNYGIVEPEPTETFNLPSKWEFSAASLFRLKRALRLQHDLDINLPGLALVNDLLEEVEQLRRQLTNVEQSHNDDDW